MCMWNFVFYSVVSWVWVVMVMVWDVGFLWIVGVVVMWVLVLNVDMMWLVLVM